VWNVKTTLTYLRIKGLIVVVVVRNVEKFFLKECNHGLMLDLTCVSISRIGTLGRAVRAASGQMSLP
jgi:hypothetical protein